MADPQDAKATCEIDMHLAWYWVINHQWFDWPLSYLKLQAIHVCFFLCRLNKTCDWMLQFSGVMAPRCLSSPVNEASLNKIMEKLGYVNR